MGGGNRSKKKELNFVILDDVAPVRPIETNLVKAPANVIKQKRPPLLESDLLRWKQFVLNRTEFKLDNVKLTPSSKSLYWSIKDGSYFERKMSMPTPQPGQFWKLSESESESEPEQTTEYTDYSSSSEYDSTDSENLTEDINMDILYED